MDSFGEESAMPLGWHYVLEGVVCGPVTAAELAGVVNAGRLRLGDLAWHLNGARGQNPARYVIANILEDSPRADCERLISVTVWERVSGAGISTGVWSDECDAHQEAVYWSLIAVATQAARDQPGLPDHDSSLAACYFDLGLLYQGATRFRQAEWAFGEALAVRERLARSLPDDIGCQQALAASLNQLGLLYLDLGSSARAEASIERAVAIRGHLLRTHPAEGLVAAGLGGALCNLGTVLAGQGRYPEALARYEAAISLLEGQLAVVERTGWAAVWNWLSPRKREARNALRSMALAYLENARTGHAKVITQLPG